jgi:serine protease inhibitor
VSPTAVYLTLVLAHLGTRGFTKEQMAVGLNLPYDCTLIKDGIKNLIYELEVNFRFNFSVGLQILCY